MKMTRSELINSYIDFFKSKGHVEVANASLVPENDPSVLFTTAGMQPLVPYLLGEDHPSGKRLCNVQRCIRTADIDEVGDTTHHTFFEMLGNWSVGDYFKKDAICFTYEFLTSVLGFDVSRLGVSCFAGDDTGVRDDEAADIWRSLGIDDSRILFMGRDDNWWEMASGGPCGPCTEVYYWVGTEKAPEVFDESDKRWVEIGNDVLMEYFKDGAGNYSSAIQKNIDFGGGVERLLAVLQGLSDNYLTDVWKPIINVIEKISYEHYDERSREMRIVADHLKAAVFMIADGVAPSNSQQGYVLRRLIRRAVRVGKSLGIEKDRNMSEPIVDAVVGIYSDRYPFLVEKRDDIVGVLRDEEEAFERTLEKGLTEFNRIAEAGDVSGQDAFLLFQSYGFPLELILEIAHERGVAVDEAGFAQELKRHQDLSRTASSGMFKSGLADESVETTRLHTATHLLNQALRVVLDDSSVQQKGSNITPERLRFDFNFDRKLTSEELKAVEDKVNEVITADLPVTFEVMPLDVAQKKGAIGVFTDKYGSDVKVYSVGEGDSLFSMELCSGPHVKRTGDLSHFRIIKEESSSAGVRRIKAILE